MLIKFYQKVFHVSSKNAKKIPRIENSIVFVTE